MSDNMTQAQAQQYMSVVVLHMLQEEELGGERILKFLMHKSPNLIAWAIVATQTEYGVDHWKSAAVRCAMHRTIAVYSKIIEIDIERRIGKALIQAAYQSNDTNAILEVAEKVQQIIDEVIK